MVTRRVLVIDDEPDIRAVIQGCLEEIAQWEVLTASSGEQGIYLATIAQPDGILLDVSMPGMGGLEVFQTLQADPTTKTIPVALLTANALPDDQKRFAMLGIAAVIVKPFDPMSLIEQITSVFQWVP